MTMPHANTSTMPVRTAVARFDGTRSTPIFASTAVTAAATADPSAKTHQGIDPPPFYESRQPKGNQNKCIGPGIGLHPRSQQTGGRSPVGGEKHQNKTPHGD